MPGYGAIGTYVWKEKPVQPTSEDMRQMYLVSEDVLIKFTTGANDASNKNKFVWSDSGTGSSKSVNVKVAGTGYFMDYKKSGWGNIWYRMMPSLVGCAMGRLTPEQCGKKPVGYYDNFMVADFCKKFPDASECACINRPEKNGRQIIPSFFAPCLQDAYRTRAIKDDMNRDLNYVDCSILNDMDLAGEGNEIGRADWRNQCQIVSEQGSAPAPAPPPSSGGTTQVQPPPLDNTSTQSSGGNGGSLSGGDSSDSSSNGGTTTQQEENNTWLYVGIGSGIVLFLIVMFVVIFLLMR